jgi:hypothetical protein
LLAAISIAIAIGRGARAQLFPSHAPLDPYFDVNAIDAHFDFDRREEMIPKTGGATNTRIARK